MEEAPKSYKERYLARKRARKENNIRLEQERLEKAHKVVRAKMRLPVL
mgnify:CR=1 FL=1